MVWYYSGYSLKYATLIKYNQVASFNKHIYYYFRGLDFREDYRKVGILQSILDSPVLTLTATCNTTMKVDIEKILGMSQVNTISFLPNRQVNYYCIYHGCY